MLESPYNFYVMVLSGDYDLVEKLKAKMPDGTQIEHYLALEGLYHKLNMDAHPDLIIADCILGGWKLLKIIKPENALKWIPIILTSENLRPFEITRAKEMKALDIYAATDDMDGLLERLVYLKKRKESKVRSATVRISKLVAKVPVWKRAFDIVVVSVALILLSPVFLLVSLIIKIDSRGPIFYKSKRVGQGYRIFDLYKFRTMKVRSDEMLKDMASMNLYGGDDKENEGDGSLCEKCLAEGFTLCQNPLFSDEGMVCETLFQEENKRKAAFFKFQNDPRITRVGTFLRNTSLDEIPQLLNILKGDISLVGNRPLPLYEAEKLTDDKSIMRFAGPGGLTGYWQVTKRGKKGGISEQERIDLDIYYSNHLSFLFDVKIILKTFPALFQSETQ